ncbi:MAG: transposase [Victivallaceae bacterium]|nr:transposase [Victivallaceae bacterium]
MPRPRTGKTHVGERREYRKNRDIYVYERVTGYNPKTRKTVTLSEHLKGKIIAGTKDIVPTRPKRKKGDAMFGSKAESFRKHTGTTELLEWIGRSSGIDKDVLASFFQGDAEKILSIARYLMATDGNSLPRMESWQVMHDLPCQYGISQDVYGDLFRSIGQNENSVQRYFRCRASVLKTKPAIAFDSTTLSTYSENQIEARQGFNKDRDGLNTIKLLTLYSIKDSEPIAFAKQPGNVPDVISIENALKQVKCLGVDKPIIVTDNGYCSQDNMAEFARRNMKFLTLADADISWVRSIIDELKEAISLTSHICPFDIHTRGASTTVMHQFKFKRHRTRGGIAAGETESFSRRLNVHVFYSQDNMSKKAVAFDESLLKLKKQLEDGETDFTQSAQRKIDRFFVLSKLGRGGHLKVGFNEEAIAEARKYFGYFALVGNQQMDTFEALENYRLREKIEEAFADQKGSLDSRKPRVWYPDNLRGRMFVQFVALGYRCHFKKRLKEIRDELDHPTPGQSKEQRALEKKLADWLDAHSVAQIMDWFDCIETTTCQAASKEVRWSTESVARDKLLLTKLGVIKE